MSIIRSHIQLSRCMLRRRSCWSYAGHEGSCAGRIVTRARRTASLLLAPLLSSTSTAITMPPILRHACKDCIVYEMRKLLTRLLGCLPLALYVVGRFHAHDGHFMLRLWSSVQAPASFQFIVGPGSQKADMPVSTLEADGPACFVCGWNSSGP